jgi:hypothetical protein
MKQTLRLSTLAGALVAAVLLPSLGPVSPSVANAGPLDPGYYYGGGYAPGYSGYSAYGYGPYGYGGYTYYAPRAYAYPTYNTYGFGYGFGTGAPYSGMFEHRFDGSRVYGQPFLPNYNPYSYGGYGPYGY